ncbi:MAG: sugar phosphate nucleotidyltransferase [Verrucomicrobiales bacterium]
MDKAFVLGAGLGTRLKTLTESIPKPLLPVLQKSLLSYAFDHLLSAGIGSIIVNTHHRPEAYAERFPENSYRGAPLTFRFEPELLETAGGIANIADLVADESFVVYNGDILTDLPLRPALAQHRRRGHLVSLILRSSGPTLQIAWDATSGKVVDIHNRLHSGAEHAYQFTGIYFVEPGFLASLTPGKKESVIPVFLDLIAREGAIGGVVADEGLWWDLGDRDSYLDAVGTIASGTEPPFPAHGARPEQQRIHPGAVIDPRAWICPRSSIAQGAVVEADARIEESVLWAGARVAAGSRLRRCIVRRDALASGDLCDADI